MLADISSDAISLLTYLLPGFVAAWLFYGLTSHPKPTQFERTIQALIFTFVVQASLPFLRWLLEAIGTCVPIRQWDKEVELLASLFMGCVLGVLIAYCTNKDSFHKGLRGVGFTSRTSHPSEWFCAFTENVTYVILNFKDGRRLYGWPKEWPVDPKKGQFYIQVPSWIDEDGKSIDLPQLDGILVHVEDVLWVEFVKEVEVANDKRPQGI